MVPSQRRHDQDCQAPGCRMSKCHGSCLKLNNSRYRNSPVFCAFWNPFSDLFTSLRFGIALVIEVPLSISSFWAKPATQIWIEIKAWNHLGTLSILFDAKFSSPIPCWVSLGTVVLVLSRGYLETEQRSAGTCLADLPPNHWHWAPGGSLQNILAKISTILYEPSLSIVAGWGKSRCIPGFCVSIYSNWRVTRPCSGNVEKKTSIWEW